MQTRILLMCVVAACSAAYGFFTVANSDDEQEEREESAMIGYVGCSNTIQTVQGYGYTGGLNMWEPDMGYDGGAVSNWVEGTKTPNKWWKTFDSLYKDNPETKAIWWQLCIRKDEPTPYRDAELVLNKIREKIPGVSIYVSPLPPYTKGVCEITGTEGIERAAALAKELDSKNADVFLGPELGPMTPKDTDPDTCHLTIYAKEKLGNQMRNFFDTKYPDRMENIEFSFNKKAWSKRIEDALKDSACEEIAVPVYPSGYYVGPLVDTHLHLPAIPDGDPEEEGADEDADEEQEGRFGGPMAQLGRNVAMSKIACNLKREGTHDNFAFFPIYTSIPGQGLEIAKRTMEKYPDVFTPFIMPPNGDDIPPTVDAATLKKMLEVYAGLFEGYGEIGLYADEDMDRREAYPPDLQLFEDIYKVVKTNKLVVYMHPGEKQKSNFARVLKAHPDINFIVHGDEIEDSILSLMDTYPNIYYGLDDFWGADMDHFHLFVGDSKEKYLKAREKEFDEVLKYEVKKWKSKIEKHPDQFIWGTDRGDAVWNYDLEVGQSMVKFARAFIGQLDPAVQEKFAHKNAERLLGKE